MIEDFQHRVDFVLADLQREMLIAAGSIRAKMAANGTESSSGAMLLKESTAREQVDAATLDLFTDAEIARRHGLSDGDVGPVLDDAIERLIAHARAAFMERPRDEFGPTYGARAEVMDQLDVRAKSLVRQYWAGYLTRSTPQGTTFSLTVSGSPGAAIQQGGQGNTQRVENVVDRTSAGKAIEILAGELAELAKSNTSAQFALEDIKTLRTQLARPEPRSSLLREIGHSARAIVEGSLAGLISSNGMAAAAHLWPSIGLN